MTWRFYLLSLPEKRMIDPDFPLEAAKVVETLSGPNVIRGQLRMGYPYSKDLLLWGAMIVAQNGEADPIAGILDVADADGDHLTTEAGGFSMYPKEQPWTAATFSSTSVDPLDVVRLIWTHIQSFPTGNLGVQVDPVKSSLRLGTPESTARSSAKKLVAEANASLTAATTAAALAAKSLVAAKTSLLAAAARPSSGLVIYQDSAPSGDKRSKLNLWIDKNAANKAYIWDGKKWVAQTTSTQVVINARLATYLAAGTSVTYSKNVVTTRKNALTKAKEKLSAVEGGEAAPYQLSWWESHDLGNIIDDLAKQTPFEFREKSVWATATGNELEHRLEIGYPTLGTRRKDIRFEIGVNAATVPQATTGAFASEVVALGAGEGQAMVRATVSGNKGRLRRVAVISRKNLKKNELAAAAGRTELLARAASWQFSSLDLIDHELAPYGSFQVGDQVEVIGDGGWIDFDSWVRITSIETDCDTGNITIGVETTG